MNKPGAEDEKAKEPPPPRGSRSAAAAAEEPLAEDRSGCPLCRGEGRGEDR